MNMRSRLENEHSKELTLQIAAYVDQDRKRLKELMEIFFSADARLSQRAAWAVGDLGAQHPERFSTFIPGMISMLQNKKAHPALHRNILRIFEKLDIPEKHQAEILDQSLAFIRSESQPVAVRAFAITVAAKISRNYPELVQELRMLLKDISAHPQTPAINVRIKRALIDLGSGVRSF